MTVFDAVMLKNVGGWAAKRGLFTGLWVGVILAVFCVSAIGSQSVSLAWDPNTDPSIAGYILYYGESSGIYSATNQVGNVSNATVSGLREGANYYFVVTAFDNNGLESDPSNEVSYNVPVARPVNPVITWANPADIVYGAPLDAYQLNASANVPGTFVYNPPAGTVLAAGMGQQLSVVFTPEDTVKYLASAQTAILNVLPAPLTISANNQGKVYGADLPVLTASYSGFVNGDSPASLSFPVILSTIATAASPVGAYAIIASGAANPNYAISFVNGNLSVTPTLLIISANSQEKAYGASLPTLTASYSGFINGDSQAGFVTPVILSTTATESSPSGTYAITASGAITPNYAVMYVNGTLTILAPQLIALTIAPATVALAVNQTAQLTATGTYSDGSTQNLTASVQWHSVDSQVASISIAGLATGLKAGNTQITATLSNVTGTAVLNVASGYGTTTLANTATISIPDRGAGSLYPSSITVSNLAGAVSKVTVTINNLSHAYPHDIGILLVGPAGQKAIVMSDAGGGNLVNNVTLTFDDASSAALTSTRQIVSGTYKPAVLNPNDLFPSPAPKGPNGSKLAVFNGALPNGVWSLYVMDDARQHLGSITSGWSLTITTTQLAPAGFSGLANASEDAGLSTTPDNGAAGAIPMLVNASPVITGLVVGNENRVRLSLQGQAGQTYIIQGSSDLIQWKDLAVTIASGEHFECTVADSVSGGPRFFRAQTENNP